MKTVLILGANGRFGGAAARAFTAAGWRVLAQVRRAGPHAHPLTVPLAEPEALAAAAQGASVVVYAVSPLYTDWTQVLPMFRQGLEVARRLGARFMLPGTVYNHGASMPARLDETTPMRPSTEKGRIRVQMEHALRDSGLDAVVLRAGDFYGAGTGSWLDQAIAKDIARGKLVLPGPPDLPHAWAYLPDLARAFVALADHPLPPGLNDFAFAGHTLTGHELLAAIDEAAASLGLRPPRGFRVGTMPWGLLRVAGLVHPMLRELTRMRYLWRVPHALDDGKLQRTVGPLPATPVVEAMRASLADFVRPLRPVSWAA